jgi:hypothetical protein
MPWCEKANVFIIGWWFHASLKFSSKAGACQSGSPIKVLLVDSMALPTNIRLGWKYLLLKNTLAFYAKNVKKYTIGP